MNAQREYGRDMDATDSHIFEALFDAAGRVPNTCEGSEGHLRDDYASSLRQDYAGCVKADDLVGAMDCVMDARDTLAEWAEKDGVAA